MGVPQHWIYPVVLVGGERRPFCCGRLVSLWVSLAGVWLLYNRRRGEFFCVWMWSKVLVLFWGLIRCFFFFFLKGYFRVDAVRRSWAGQDQAFDGIRCIGWRWAPRLLEWYKMCMWQCMVCIRGWLTGVYSALAAAFFIYSSLFFECFVVLS